MIYIKIPQDITKIKIIFQVSCLRMQENMLCRYEKKTLPSIFIILDLKALMSQVLSISQHLVTLEIIIF